MPSMMSLLASPLCEVQCRCGHVKIYGYAYVGHTVLPSPGGGGEGAAGGGGGVGGVGSSALEAKRTARTDVVHVDGSLDKDYGVKYCLSVVLSLPSRPIEASFCLGSPELPRNPSSALSPGGQRTVQ